MLGSEFDHFRLVLMLRMNGATYLLPNTPLWRKRGQIYNLNVFASLKGIILESILRCSET